MKWLIKKYMAENQINSYEELSDRTGIALRTLIRRINYPRQLKVYEIDALNEVLNLSNDDLLTLVRGK